MTPPEISYQDSISDRLNQLPPSPEGNMTTSLDLLKHIMAVTTETMKIADSLPPLDISEDGQGA